MFIGVEIYVYIPHMEWAINVYFVVTQKRKPVQISKSVNKDF